MIVHKLLVSTRLICNCERLCQMMRTIRSISISGWFSPQLHQPRPQTPMSCHCHGVMFSAAHLGSPGLTQAVAAGGSLSGRNYISPPHRLSTLHWEHYPHRILRHCTKQESLLTSCTHCSPQNFDALCFAACLSFIITPGPYLRQPLNFPSKDQICLILKLNFHVPTTASLAAH